MGVVPLTWYQVPGTVKEEAAGPDPGRGPGRSFGPRTSRPLLAMSREPNIMPRINTKYDELNDKAIN